MRYIGIAAYSGKPDQVMISSARTFIRELSQLLNVRYTALVVGGYWGLMRHVVDEALLSGFKVIILPPIEREEVKYPGEALVVKTGASYRVRSVFLVRSSEVLVVLGGGAGSLQEAVTAYTECKPIIVLSGTGMPTDKLRDFAPYIDERRCSKIIIEDNPASLARRVAEYLGGEA